MRFRRIRHTGDHIDVFQEDLHTMSDQGLSIFDEPDGESADEQPTQVMKAQARTEARKVVHARTAEEEAGAAGRRGRGRPRSRPRAGPAAAPAPAAATGGRPLPPPRTGPVTATTASAPASPAAPAPVPATFATVRRGGYDKAAVDAHLRQVQQEKSGVGSA